MLSFHLSYSFLCCAKVFNQVPLVYFGFYFHYSRRWVIEDVALIYDIECSAYVFPKRFIVPGVTFRSLIHFEFLFEYGVKKCSNFILLHVAVHFSHHRLLKRLSLPHCIFLSPVLFHWSIFLFLQSTDFYATGINKLISRWQKCVDCNGSYFDSQR